MANKIIRTICYFQKDPNDDIFQKLDDLEKLLKEKGFEIQTKRLCSSNVEKVIELDKVYSPKGYFFAVGTIGKDKIDSLIKTNNIAFNYDLTSKEIDLEDVKMLFSIVNNVSAKTFNFAYVFNNLTSTPYFPAANYEKDGFSIGLQSTDLAEGCNNLDEWLVNMKNAWFQLINQSSQDKGFLGIDSSIAPFADGKGSLINFIKKITGSFEKSVTTNIYTQITNFIKKENPKPVGLCGLMFPCLEDFELTEEYEKGNFNIERNIYLSLHSGVGIDTYPIGIDEKPERVLEILKLLQSLSNKYGKPLSARFVSDGKAKIRETTDFKNQYLKDIIVRSI